jgi:hypothetical protein
LDRHSSTVVLFQSIAPSTNPGFKQAPRQRYFSGCAARAIVAAGSAELNVHKSEIKKQKAGLIAQTGLFNLIPATTYAPTQLPVQYHRPGEA